MMPSLKFGNAVIHICVGDAESEFESLLREKASRIRNCLLQRGIFDSVFVVSPTDAVSPDGYVLVIGDKPSVLSKLGEARSGLPDILTMFEEHDTGCLLDLSDPRRVGLFVSSTVDNQSETTAAIRASLHRTVVQLQTGPEDWAGTCFGQICDPESNMSHSGDEPDFIPGQDGIGQIEHRIELAVLRYIREVAELTWLELAADIAAGGVLVLRERVSGRKSHDDLERNNRAVRALDFQLNLKPRILAESLTLLEPFQKAAAEARNADELHPIYHAADALLYWLGREAELHEIKGLLPSLDRAALVSGDAALRMRVTNAAGEAHYVRLLRALHLFELSSTADDFRKTGIAEFRKRMEAEWLSKSPETNA